jgi:hypothetical protein
MRTLLHNPSAPARMLALTVLMLHPLASVMAQADRDAPGTQPNSAIAVQSAVDPVWLQPGNAPAMHLSAEQHLQISTAVATTTLASAINQSVRGLAATAALAQIEQFAGDSAVPMAYREAALLQFVNMQRQQPQQDSMRTVLAQLTAFTAQVTRTHLDHPAHAQAAFPVANAARGVLNQWDYQAICSQTIALSTAQLIEWWQNNPERDQQWLLLAIDNHDISFWQAHELLDARQPLNPDMHAVTVPVALLFAAAMRKGDLQGMAETITEVPPAQAIAALHSSPYGMTAALVQAASNHPAAVLAVLARNRMQMLSSARSDNRSLLQLLMEPDHGATAAMQLADKLSAEELNQLRADADADNHLLQARLKLIAQLQEDWR